MQNVGQDKKVERVQDVKTIEVGQAALSPSSPVMEKSPVLTAIKHQNFITDLSGSDDDDVSEVS